MGIGPLQIVGVDYGSKLAGTTAMAWMENDSIRMSVSAKKEDADAWLLEQLEILKPKLMFIDAPLSLPAVYTKGEYAASADYFYRQADRAASAMSPMFIGGLTARAMRLKAQLEDIECIESYPKLLAEALGLMDLGYKQKDGDLQACAERLEGELSVPFDQAPPHWHALDAALALLTGVRWLDGRAKRLGDASEGLIWF
jgi:predicted nuclease with RNAse H fold